MKKKCMILFLVIAGLLGGTAFAENTSLYSGDWVPVQIVPAGSYVYAERYPSQWAVELPELALHEDGEAYLLQDDLTESSGRWNYDQDQISIRWEQGDEQVFSVHDGKLVFRGEIPEIGEASLTYARKENAEMTGTWEPLLQTDEHGNYWNTAPGTENIIFPDDEHYRLSADVSENGEGTEGLWTRRGNDIILYVHAFSENGVEGEYPYQFFQLDQGLLKRYEYRDEYNMMAVLYGNKARQPEFTEVESVRPLLNTIWELAAKEINGVPVQLSSLGCEAGEFLMFSAKANGGIMRMEQGESKLVKFSLRLEDGALQFTLRDGSKVHCRLADHQYLTRVTGNGQTLYYRKQISAEYPGLAEDAVSVMDVILEKPENTTIAAGEKLQFKAHFADADFVSQEKGNNGIRWSVTDSAGNDVRNIEIDQDGLLSVDQAFTGNAEVTVTAASEAYGTCDSLTVLIGTAR